MNNSIKKNPARPTNAFSLGQVMQDASQEIGPGTSYGIIITLLFIVKCFYFCERIM